MPIAADLERVGFQAEEILMLARVDLDLELERVAIAGLRGEFEYQVYGMSGGVVLEIAEP